MTTSELRAAAKSILDTPVYWTGHPDGGPGNWHPDKSKVIAVCNYVLAANPADDEELCEIGTYAFTDNARLEVRVEGIGRRAAYIQHFQNNWEWCYLRDVKTRGDLRRLCSALGIPLKS